MASERESLFDSLPDEVKDALQEARAIVEVWFGGGDPDTIAVRLDSKLDAMGVPK